MTVRVTFIKNVLNIINYIRSWCSCKTVFENVYLQVSESPYLLWRSNCRSLTGPILVLHLNLLRFLEQEWLLWCTRGTLERHLFDERFMDHPILDQTVPFYYKFFLSFLFFIFLIIPLISFFSSLFMHCLLKVSFSFGKTDIQILHYDIKTPMSPSIYYRSYVSV